MRLAAAVLALTLAGCGTVRALAGPDPALVDAAPTIEQALANEMALHPENKDAIEKARAALKDASEDKTAPTADLIADVAGLMTSVPGLGGLGTALAGGAYLWKRRNEKKKPAETKPVA